MNSFVTCACASPLMQQNYGKEVKLTYSEARLLEAQGHVKITDRSLTQNHLDNTSYFYRKGFSKRKLTRIAWVQNYSKHGGAEISNFSAVRVGNLLGFDIIGCNIDDERNLGYALENCDIPIINNLHSGSHDRVIARLFESGKPYIVYSHDCFETETDLFKRAALNVFISPRHMQHYVDLCGEDIVSKSIQLPLAFNVDQWGHTHNGRIPGSVLVTNYEKCRENVIEYIQQNQTKKYFITGNTVPVVGDITRLPVTFYDDMPSLYAKYETLLHLPGKLAAGDRVLFEAIMSGCKVITNTNAGHASWIGCFDWRDEKVLRPILRNAVYCFWNKVGAL